MKKFLSVFMSVVMILSCYVVSSVSADTESVIKTTIDFESTALPTEFTRYGGAAEIATGMSADGAGNACLIKPGAIYYINDGISWVNFESIYFNADVRAEEGANYMCFGTHRFRTDTSFVSFNNGDILVGGTNAGSYTPGQWYELTAVVDRSVNTIDVWLDGTKIANDVAVTFNNADANMYIGFNVANNTGNAYIDDITLSDTIPAEYAESTLKITSSNPADGTEKVEATDTQFTVSFNYPLNEETVSDAVSIDNGATVSDDISYDADSNSIVFTVSDLTYETTYTITIAETITGKNGEKLDENADNTISFTTDVAPGTPISTIIDFEESALPSVFTRYGGSATVQSGKAADGASNACYMQYGSTYYINDGNSWVNSDIIYFNADVYAEKGVNFICFATRRYSGNSPFVALSDGDILVNTTKVGSYIPNTWYEVTAVLNRSADTIDVWFDGIRLADDIAVNFIHEDENSYIGFLTNQNVNNSGAYIDDITISNTVPEISEVETFEVTSVSPANGTENIGIDAPAEFRISFDTPLLESTVPECVKADNGAVVSDIAYEAATSSVTFKVSNLAYSTVYTLSIDENLTSEDGKKINKFAEGSTIKFITVDEDAEKITTVIDFEADELPAVFTRRGGKATVTPGAAADGTSNACYLQSGSTYYVNDGNTWVASAKKIYFNADVYAEEGATFVCLSTQRYATNTPFVSFDNGDILVAGTKVGSYTANRWYELTAAINRVTNVIDVWVNGVKLADDVSVSFNNADAVTYVAFSTQNSTTGAYIDDITISNKIPYIPENGMYVECVDSKIKVTASFNSNETASDNCRIYVAAYGSDDKLSTVTVSDKISVVQGLNSISFETDSTENVKSVRAFLWDDNLVPLCGDVPETVSN